MVMGKNMMAKNLRQSIRNSLGRYIAIISIIALGAAMFVGLRTTKSDMVDTGQEYMDGQNMFDLRLLNPYGWTQDHVDAVAQMEGVQDAEGILCLDAVARPAWSDAEGVYKCYAIPETVNQVYLLSGRMPENSDECLVDASRTTDAVLGSTVTLSGNNSQDTLDRFAKDSFTVVGRINSPLYMDTSRGSTTIGNGSVTGFLYLPRDSFTVDYFTEIDLTLPGAYSIYTEEYNNAMDSLADALAPQLEPLAAARYAQVLEEAEASYADGLAQYQDGEQEYENGKAKTESELADARKELEDAAAELEEKRLLLSEGQEQLTLGKQTLEDSLAALAASRKTLADTKAETYAQLSAAGTELLENYKAVTDGQRQVDDGLRQIEDGLTQLNPAISQLESGIAQLDMTISIINNLSQVMDTSIEAAQRALDQAKESGAVDETIIAELEARLAELQEKKAGYADQYQKLLDDRDTYTGQLSALQGQRDSLQAQKEELAAQKEQLLSALDAINTGILELENGQREAENQFAAAQAQIEAGQAELDEAQRTLEQKQAELDEGSAALEEAVAQLAQAQADYQAGANEADQRLRDAREELDQAQADLAQARQDIDSLEPPETYVLTRNTNSGYLSLDSNSDIVAGISKVFPAFFLLVAALVCITTMSRMVAEERTQIGTLKALGYGSGEIIGKYLFYAGSAAILGCGLGVVAGSVVFPSILWKSYSIILNVTPHLLLHLDWKLCVLVVASYTAVCLLVTWYCCRRALREEPAELIRPKAPTSGKRIFLEYLSFWDKIGFLNKVMVRNVFRYRQRLLMMLLGIGGCTALLLTGFGVGDSIMDIVDYQYEEVTLYDIQVRFSGGMEERAQQDFREEISPYVDAIDFFYQNTVDLDYGSATQSVTLLSGDSQMEHFFDLHQGKTHLNLPGKNEALLSIGTANHLGISEGDQITLRTSDMQALTLTVTGIFDNNVYNYVIVSPETLAAQWGNSPDSQMAFITVGDTQDVHEAGAKIGSYEGVMNVAISADLAEQVDHMLEALNLVVLTVVICAVLLAVIVLYNLTNINITERIREIATLKVLGFTEAESAAYVFKENFLLAAMGAVIGLLGGRLLLEFVMGQIQVDMVWFQARLLPVSFLLSILLTLLATCAVDLIFFFRLQKINMAEALKSVE